MQPDRLRIVCAGEAEITASLVDRRAQAQRTDILGVDTDGCVEVPQGHIVIMSHCVSDPTVVVEVTLMGSQFNGRIVILERVLQVALGNIRRGSLRKHKKALVAVDNVAVQ